MAPIHRFSCAAVLVTAMAVAAGFAAADWPMANHDLSGSHFQPDETAIGAANVGRLAARWTLSVAGIVNATPAVVNGAVYFPDSGGTFWKIDAKNGKVICSVSVPELTGMGKAFSRTSPACADGMLFIAANPGAHLIAVDAETGKKRWMTQLDAHPSARLTSSPVVVGDRIYMPVSSNEQSAGRSAATPVAPSGQHGRPRRRDRQHRGRPTRCPATMENRAASAAGRRSLFRGRCPAGHRQLRHH